MQKIYVGNLPFDATEEQVQQLFAEFGAVSSVALPTDRETGRPRGFGFVEMGDAEARTAIAALAGREFGGRMLNVNEAKPREDRSSSRGGGGSGGGYSGNRW
jgi:RNA recognition motif-containing protein